MTPFCLSFFPFLQATVMFWMLNWILACPILVWTEANVFSSDLGDTNANALEQITMETAVKKVKFEAGCKFWDRNLVWHYFHIFLLQNVRQDWVPTLLECPKNHQIFHLIVWLFENSLKCKKVETLYCEKKVVFLFVIYVCGQKYFQILFCLLVR